MALEKIRKDREAAEAGVNIIYIPALTAIVKQITDGHDKAKQQYHVDFAAYGRACLLQAYPDFITAQADEAATEYGMYKTLALKSADLPLPFSGNQQALLQKMQDARVATKGKKPTTPDKATPEQKAYSDAQAEYYGHEATQLGLKLLFKRNMDLFDGTWKNVRAAQHVTWWIENFEAKQAKKSGISPSTPQKD